MIKNAIIINPFKMLNILAVCTPLRLKSSAFLSNTFTYRTSLAELARLVLSIFHHLFNLQEPG